MIHKVLRSHAQEYGGFTDLFIIGNTRRYDAATKSWLSDFTADVAGVSSGSATTSMVFNLIQLTETLPAAGVTQAAVPRYIVGFPGAMAITRWPVLDSSGTNILLNVGVNASVTTSASLIAGTAGDGELQDRVTLPAAATIPLAPNTVSQYVTATLVSALGAVSTISTTPKVTNPGGAVEFWIYVCLLPYREWVLNRDV
jgi:hypothetical protein